MSGAFGMRQQTYEASVAIGKLSVLPKVQGTEPGTFIVAHGFSCREQIEALIISHGGKISGSVSKKTHYVVAGDAPGSKVEKAQSIGVPVITEAELRAMIV